MATVILVLHLLGASVWVGGHLVLLLAVLPKALRQQDHRLVLAFEERYERVGVPALVVQLLTGLWLANRYVPGILPAFDLEGRLHVIVAVKLSLLFTTILVGAHARLRIIPRLDPGRLGSLAGHILLVNALAIGLVVAGAMVRDH